MKITSRATSWGIELKNDTVEENIFSNNQIELKETILNFLNTSNDMVQFLDSDKKDEIWSELYDLIEKIENERTR